MNWPFELIFFSIVMTFIWTALFRWSRKIDSANFFVGSNCGIYVLYILLLFRPLFIHDLGKGGGAFAAGMYIMILSPIHLALTFIAVLIFKKTTSSKRLSKALLLIGLPAATLALGYLIADRKNDVEERNSQVYFEELNRESENEAIRNSRSVQQFESFLKMFSSDSAFQKSRTNLPLAVFQLNENLEVDTVTHYYDHNWKPFKFQENNLTWTYTDWEYLKKKSTERVISRKEENFIVDYNFRFDNDWELFDIKKRKITGANPAQAINSATPRHSP
ncbi:hypothetical protein OB13_08490 [Pontibacter sp. HJ8]